jgi:hypothetical protein
MVYISAWKLEFPPCAEPFVLVLIPILVLDPYTYCISPPFLSGQNLPSHSCKFMGKFGVKSFSQLTEFIVSAVRTYKLQLYSSKPTDGCFNKSLVA